MFYFLLKGKVKVKTETEQIIEMIEHLSLKLNNILNKWSGMIFNGVRLLVSVILRNRRVGVFGLRDLVNWKKLKFFFSVKFSSDWSLQSFFSLETCLESGYCWKWEIEGTLLSIWGCESRKRSVSWQLKMRGLYCNF